MKMKLRNKNTGELVEVYKLGLVWNVYRMPASIGQYDSLAELNEDWEDYNPAEPLIKDEKIRKAVRAWAEANGLSDKLKVINEYFNCCKVLGRNDAHNVCHVIEFGTTIAGAGKNRCYTIAELCGEEK